MSGNTNDPKLDFHYFLQITTQKCLEKVREREYAGDPTSHKSYVITADQYCMTTPVMNSHKRLQKLSKLLETFSHSTIEPLLKSSEESVMARGLSF